MKHIHLPDLNVRSHTPMSTKSKDLRNSPIKVSTTISSVRNISLSSNRISSGSYKDSKEGTRPVSDETSLTLMDQDSGIKRFGTFLSEIPHKSKHKPTKFVEKLKNYDEVIDGIFKIYNCERSRLHAISLVQLFLGLGYVEEGDTIIEIFKYITEAQNIQIISFSRAEMIKICEDYKTEYILQNILRDLRFKPNSDNSSGLYALINVIKRWWNKLDKSRNGFVPIEDISKFYMEIGVIESSSDSKRIQLKFDKFGNFKQFYSVFAKALVKYLMTELAKLVKKGTDNCVSAEISIASQRRKVILNSLEGENKVLDAIIECNVYNDNL